MTGNKRISLRPILLLVLCLLIVMYLARSMTRQGDITYGELRQMFVQEKVQSFTINDTRLTATLKDQSVATCQLYDFDLFYDDLNDLVVEQYNAGIITSYNYYADHSTNWLQILLPYALAIMAFILLMNLMSRMNGGGAGGVSDKMAHFGEARVSSIPEGDKKVTFKDVAGADEEKEELQEIVEFLRDPEKYLKLGAHIPKGVLLVGPPGTGKTLLAKAVAGEAGVKFLSISGSDFVEMYVGVGASRVRDLFVQAKKDAPAIVFIDEIDAVGRQRGAGLGGGHDEREQTLNQLLVEMDGFGANEGVIVMAATNRPDILDKALLRPGRFDRQITVNYPDVKGREEILKVHSRGKPLGPDVNLATIAKSSSGFTGADLANLLNEAALLAVRHGKKAITQQEIEEATIKVVMGAEKKSHIVSDKDKKVTAYHEAGHAIVSYFLPTQDPVHQISIIQRGMAAGYTMYLPVDEKGHTSKKQLAEQICSLLGGRAAEQLTQDDVCTGASNDIERATALARQMVTKFGMSDKLGLVTYGHDDNEVFLGRDFSSTPNYSEKTAAVIDEEIEAVVMKQYAKALELLNGAMPKLHEVAKVLFEKEKISGDEFRAIMEQQ